MCLVRTPPRSTGPVRRPREPERSVEQSGLGVAAAARRLGVAPATLRTWDRRYGLGPTGHTPGRHRRYRPDDVARLELMQYALVRGATPAEAARYATSVPLPTGPDTAAADLAAATRTPDRPAADSLVPGPCAPTSTPSREAAGAVAADASRRPPDGAPRAGRYAQGLARAALTLDPVPVRALLAESIAVLGVEPSWDEVVRPVLRAVCERWAHSGAGVEVEHQLSECVTAAFGRLAAESPVSVAARPVLLAGMPGEQHVLPVVALAAALAGHRVPFRMLGPSLPIGAMAAAIRRTAPAAVVLWAQVAATADVAALDGLPRTRPHFRTFVAGPGWAQRTLPARVTRLDSLRDARAAVVAVVAL